MLSTWPLEKAFFCMVDGSFGLCGISYTLARLYSIQDLICCRAPQKSMYPKDITWDRQSLKPMEKSQESMAYFALLLYMTGLNEAMERWVRGLYSQVSRRWYVLSSGNLE